MRRDQAGSRTPTVELGSQGTDLDLLQQARDVLKQAMQHPAALEPKEVISAASLIATCLHLQSNPELLSPCRDRCALELAARRWARRTQRPSRGASR